ncbi:chromosome segregation protein SMC [Humibacillus sp. DSM 29435]|uniref:chromosome segregation protein SMC n=1 Tax=Humibacillus sp. DSM 29435 TaxID=1869167 RepID=UPI0008730FAF|nr:chromosome segregation protein SMC [Humibacillus sp. DSM 29435]OFE16671.1 chromosome segregation protein SMC [Humibacillus sp. DSM 29435]
MYVKSLTLKGFKSFASATHLRLEPGITCIVGPNGSGKSNVVDALAWVMGEQGAKSLRGGKMEDVIFAGTAGRPPLGRAEVALTIDNTDGALPIDYSEVTIARTMFRNGGSDYSINGTSCRLLDVQELLSDSGIGREMHVIVGQGQLDTVLRATPEERRGFIEEAAGVLKHRKRKERALRKLETMEANLTRVADLTGEIRRQLGPLGRQAETARKAAMVQADARDARLRLLADDLVQLTSTLEQEVADESALITRRTEVEQALGELANRLGALEAEAEAARPALSRAQDDYVALGRLVERLSATRSLADERVRLLRDEEGTPEAGGGARDPEQLRSQAAQVRGQEQSLLAEIAGAATDLEVAVAARAAAEQEQAEETTRLARASRAAADRREGLAKLAGQVGAAASRIEARQAEIGRLRTSIGASQARATEAEREWSRLEAGVAHDEEGEQGLDAAYESAAALLEEAEAEVAQHTEAEAAADRARTTAGARVEALELSLSRKDGAAALLAAADERHGILGSVAALVTVEPGLETAVAAALGRAAEALAVQSLEAAGMALDALRAGDDGRVMLLVSESADSPDPSGWPDLGVSARWVRDAVQCPDAVRPAVDRVLDRVALVDDPESARRLVLEHPGVTAVTPDGDVYAPGTAWGGSTSAPSLIELQAALDDARARVATATSEGERARFAGAAARSRRDELNETVEATLERLHESDARMSAIAEQLGSLGQALRSARAETERTEQALAVAEAALEADQAQHAALAERLEAASAEGVDEAEPSTEQRDRLDEAARSARTAETELRLALRTREERARALRERADALERGARHEEETRARMAARLERRRREAEVAEAVGVAARYAYELLAVSADEAARVRAEGEADRTARDAELAVVRRDAATLQNELRELTDSVHRDEVARTQQRLRIEALHTRAVDELGISPEALVDEFGPHQLVPFVPDPDAEPGSVPREPVAFVRTVQEKRLRAAERRLGALGRINPLALEEFSALEERHKFLTEQLEDLRSSKRDLLDIIKEVDDRVEKVFAEAFADTAVQFERVFQRLFPGGEGRLLLTDPSNMLTTGLEVEARPPGKKIKRLSLLSGGERSLVAVALLVAIFKARPSPFYIMDEVEAALDDANLGRLITLFEELRDSSQLIVITHQKKTMEIADALYGVSMRGDGVTTVVSQRLRDVADQPA